MNGEERVEERVAGRVMVIKREGDMGRYGGVGTVIRGYGA